MKRLRTVALLARVPGLHILRDALIDNPNVDLIAVHTHGRRSKSEGGASGALPSPRTGWLGEVAAGDVLDVAWLDVNPIPAGLTAARYAENIKDQLIHPSADPSLHAARAQNHRWHAP